MCINKKRKKANKDLYVHPLKNEVIPQILVIENQVFKTAFFKATYFKIL